MCSLTAPLSRMIYFAAKFLFKSSLHDKLCTQFLTSGKEKDLARSLAISTGRIRCHVFIHLIWVNTRHYNQAERDANPPFLFRLSTCMFTYCHVNRRVCVCVLIN